MNALRPIFLTIVGAVRALASQARAKPLEAEAVLIGLILFVAAIQIPSTEPSRTDGRILISGDDLAVDVLEDTFAGLGYTLEQIREEDAAVPRLIVSAVPDGLKDIRIVDRRKRLFFRTVLPLILTVNEEIAADRERLLRIASELKADGSGEADLNADDIAWIDGLAERYGIDLVEENVSLPELVSVLKMRVAPVPTSLALAQAVEESAWGTSRFAREGNALFGQWVWDEDAGIVPEEQRDGQEYAVRAFESPLHSVRAYTKNLNTHWAYTKFREKRQALLDAGEKLDGWALAETLTRYSERREEYVKSLHAIMRVNKLRPLDDATLAAPETMLELAQAI